MQGSGGIAFNGLTPEMMQQIQRLLDAEEKAKAAQQEAPAQAQAAPAQAPVVEEFELPAQSTQSAGIPVVVDNGQGLQAQRPARELGVA